MWQVFYHNQTRSYCRYVVIMPSDAPAYLTDAHQSATRFVYNSRLKMMADIEHWIAGGDLLTGQST